MAYVSEAPLRYKVISGGGLQQSTGSGLDRRPTPLKYVQTTGTEQERPQSTIDRGDKITGGGPSEKQPTRLQNKPGLPEVTSGTR